MKVFGAVFVAFIAIAVLQWFILLIGGVESRTGSLFENQPLFQLTPKDVLIFAVFNVTFIGLLMAGLVALEAQQGGRPGIHVRELLVPMGMVALCALVATTLIALEAVPILVVGGPPLWGGGEWMGPLTMGWAISGFGFFLMAIYVWRRRVTLAGLQ